MAYKRITLTLLFLLSFSSLYTQDNSRQEEVEKLRREVRTKYILYDKEADFEYILSAKYDGIIITKVKYKSKKPSAVIIPDTIEEVKVVGIYSKINKKRESELFPPFVAMVVLPNNISSLPPSLFSHCVKLQKVLLPSFLTSIGEDLFFDCEALKSVTFPSSLKEVRFNAFNSCLALEEVTIPEGVQVIASHAFDNCIKLKTVSLPNSIQKIGDAAFSNCRLLTSIALPASLTTIEESVFYNCESLKEVSFGSAIVAIEKNAFYSCRSLESVTLPATLKVIEECAFYDCSKLKVLECPSLEEIDNTLLTTSLEKNSVKLGKNAFYGCRLLSLKVRLLLKKLGCDYL